MIKKVLFIMAVFCMCDRSHAQKYNFVNWTVEDGLIQSQASYLCQDDYHQLWVATLGGVCKFDGRSFKGFTMQDGLISNHTNVVYNDRNGNLWIGTNYGISVFNGTEFRNIKLTTAPVNNVTEIVKAEGEKIFAVSDAQLYTIHDDKPQKIQVTSGTDEKILSIYLSSKKQLLALVHKKGLFALEKGKWKQVVAFDPAQPISFREIFITRGGDTLLGSGSGLYRVKNGAFEKLTLEKNFDKASIQHITEDSNNAIWLGTNGGAYKLKGNSLTHFDARSGLTDNSVFHIFVDSENNLWFATDADGIFKYRENMFTYYDKLSGLTNPSIMGIVRTTDNEVYAAGYGGVLHKINKDNLIESVNDDAELSQSRINCMYADDENNIWIGTVGKGIWKYRSGKGLRKIESEADHFPRTITFILKDANGNLLIASPSGLFILDKSEKFTKVQSVETSVNCLLTLSDNTILAGTPSGVFILTRDYKYKELEKKEFANSSVLCLARNDEAIWLGTTNKGVLCWNIKTDKIYNYSKKEGLPNDFVYFINVDQRNNALVGTGYGITNLSVNNEGEIVEIKNYGKPDGLTGMECNNNAVLKAADSTYWFGTARGLFHYNPHAESVQLRPPFILLKAVKLFSSEIKDSSLYSEISTWFKIPDNLSLAHNQNNLTFELGSVYFTNPNEVQYKYRIEGLEKSDAVSNNGAINFSALPPGKYIFKAQALTKAGMLSSNIISYPFEIRKAFWQTAAFQALIVALLIAFGALVMYLIARRKQNQARMLQKIREEEFNKLRQRTAEDFHDEMGNKLTRISVLADILKSKVNGHQVETAHLIEQIKDNTGALYSGSRDIIWSLNAQNDGLPEIIERVNEKGIEMFGETNIEFRFSHNILSSNPLKLKLDYSRNLIMIFKEVYNNILKHSGAMAVDVSIDLVNNSDLLIHVNDNGKGFNSGIDQKGNGLKNIKNRANRLNGEVIFTSHLQKGTHIQMSLKNLFI